MEEGFNKPSLSNHWSDLRRILDLSSCDLTKVNYKIISDEDNSAPSSSFEDDEDEVVSQIKELLYTRVRPAVAQDGGDIVFEDFTDGTVTVQMRGACAGCPSSTATLKMGIENMLRHYIPEVKEVVAAEM